MSAFGEGRRAGHDAHGRGAALHAGVDDRRVRADAPEGANAAAVPERQVSLLCARRGADFSGA